MVTGVDAKVPPRRWLSQHVYNISLIATMIAHKRAEATEAWLRGVKANLAHKPAGGDREQARDIYSGMCDIALGNTYITWR
jgi:iron(III) transport system substrate-binding protein